MIAITLWQPWASLLACGAKKYETRGWNTNYRGPIAIHAATRPVDIRNIPRDAHYPMAQALMRYARQFAHTPGYNIFSALPRGAIIATAELVGCHKMEATQGGTPYLLLPGGFPDAVTEQELLFGDWTPGRYAWEFANMKMFETPIPAKGKQGLWNWDGEAT